jgi:hypothetical protein
LDNNCVAGIDVFALPMVRKSPLLLLPSRRKSVGAGVRCERMAVLLTLLLADQYSVVISTIRLKAEQIQLVDIK